MAESGGAPSPVELARQRFIAGDTATARRECEAILKGTGCGFSDVVKASVFLVDLADFAEMNRVFAARFGEHRPARSTVQVSKLPAGARVEIDFVAIIPAAQR